jgi:signal transduction histidine kinase
VNGQSNIQKADLPGRAGNRSLREGDKRLKLAASAIIDCHKLIRAAILPILLVISLNAGGGEPRRVLLIHSFGQDFQPFITFSEDFRSGLARQSRQPVDFFDVALAGARYETPEEAAFVDYLGALFAGHRLDLVVPMGAPAVGFAQKYRARLFPDTPMLLAAVDQRLVQTSRLTANDAVIAVRHDPRLLVEAILRLMPDTTNVVLVFGNSPLERFWADEVMRESQLPTDHIGCESFSRLSFEQMKRRAATLPRGSVILFGDLLVDADGIPQTGDEALVNLHAAANAPIFGVHDFQLGQGIVGGPLVSVHELARQSASAAARILEGESPASFRPPPMGASVPTYDWRELRRWNIGEERLPAGSVIMYRTPTLWQRHRVSIISGTGILVAQTTLIMVLVLNLRRRQKAERSLRESEERMKLAAGAAQLGMWEWDLASNKVWVAAGSRERMAAVREGNSDYSRFMQTVHPDDRDSVAQAVAEAMAGDGIYEHVHRRVLPDGQIRWVAGRGKVEFDAARKPLMMRGVGLDITARKLAEEQARFAQEEAQRLQQELAHVSRVSMLGELAGSLAHELNQPLTAIVSNAEAAERFMKPDRRNEEEVCDALKDILEQGHRAGEIIARIRAMLKKDPGQMATQDMNLAVRDVLEMIRSDLVIKRVTPILRLDPQLPAVSGHGVQLRQVLLNLVMNACDAMAHVPAEQRELTIQSRPLAADEVEVSVADTGSGFQDEVLHHVFEPFRTTKAQGLGLGLAICRSIIRTHGGRLFAANNPDKGATLRFTLPAQSG